MVENEYSKVKVNNEMDYCSVTDCILYQFCTAGDSRRGRKGTGRYGVIH